MAATTLIARPDIPGRIEPGHGLPFDSQGRVTLAQATGRPNLVAAEGPPPQLFAVPETVGLRPYWDTVETDNSHLPKLVLTKEVPEPRIPCSNFSYEYDEHCFSSEFSNDIAAFVALYGIKTAKFLKEALEQWRETGPERGYPRLLSPIAYVCEGNRMSHRFCIDEDFLNSYLNTLATGRKWDFSYEGAWAGERIENMEVSKIIRLLEFFIEDMPKYVKFDSDSYFII